MDAARELPELGEREREVLGDLREHERGVRVAAADLRLGDPDGQRHRHEPLLGAVVEVALDPPARGVAGLDDACARGGELLAGLDVRDRLGDQLAKSPSRASAPAGSGSSPRPGSPDHAPRFPAAGDRRRGGRPDLQPADDRVLRRQLPGLRMRRPVSSARLVALVATIFERRPHRDAVLGRAAPARDDLTAPATARERTRR